MKILEALVCLPVGLLLIGCRGGDAPASSDAAAANAAPQTASAGAPLAGRQTFVIVPAESKASYIAQEEFFGRALKLLGISPGRVQAVGSTREIRGQFQLDPERPATGLGDNSFTVRMDTLTSNQSKRDDYLREVRDDGPSFYSYPTATFKATAIRDASRSSASGLTVTLTGDLTIRDITKPVAFDVTAQLAGDTLTGIGKTRFLLSDFGIGPIDFYDTVTVADEIGIEVEFTARAQPK